MFRNLAALLLLTSGGLAACGAGAAESANALPPPDSVPTPTAANTETAVLAGGCFWGVQGVYQHLKGVKNVLSGYAGGERDTATYDVVSGGDTGHAESVQIVYDPRQVSYGQILQVFFSIAHDPTQLNRQGRMSVRSIGRQFSTPTIRRRRSRSRTSRSSTPRRLSRAAS
jgi:peptide-methionine (S)-S-oxide reductase